MTLPVVMIAQCGVESSLVGEISITQISPASSAGKWTGSSHAPVGPLGCFCMTERSNGDTARCAGRAMLFFVVGFKSITEAAVIDGGPPFNFFSGFAPYDVPDASPN